ncbi:MAG: copper-binding protein [Pseudomonadota bacterium]
MKKNPRPSRTTSGSRSALAAVSLALASLVAHAAGPLAPAEGEVRKVDKATGKISLKHGEIKNLDMPPMSMVFQVQDPALLDKVKAGDKVTFTADMVKGSYTVMSIEPKK